MAGTFPEMEDELCQLMPGEVPSAAYFRAGRALLDSLAHTLPQPLSQADLAQAKQAHPAGRMLAGV